MAFEIDTAILGLIGINIVLTIILTGVYLKNYRTISSKMTLGLVIFALAFLVENIMNLFFYNSLLAQGITGITTFHLVANFIEMVALLVLAWITWK